MVKKTIITLLKVRKRALRINKIRRQRWEDLAKTELPKRETISAGKKKLIIAFKIEDENGNDITPDVSNTLYTYLGEGVEVDKSIGTAVRLSLRNYLFNATLDPLIRQLFPEYHGRVPAALRDKNPDRFRWLVSAVWETRSRIEHLRKSNLCVCCGEAPDEW